MLEELFPCVEPNSKSAADLTINEHVGTYKEETVESTVLLYPDSLGQLGDKKFLGCRKPSCLHLEKRKCTHYAKVYSYSFIYHSNF